jgi:hypothetical protein
MTGTSFYSQFPQPQPVRRRRLSARTIAQILGMTLAVAIRELLS